MDIVHVEPQFSARAAPPTNNLHMNQSGKLAAETSHGFEKTAAPCEKTGVEFLNSFGHLNKAKLLCAYFSQKIHKRWI